MSKGKYHSLSSYTSGLHYSNDMHEDLLKNDFPEFSGHLNIEEFLDWLMEVGRFFEDRNIAKKKQVKFVCRKLKGSAWAWWEQLQRMRTRLGKDPIQHWEKMKKYLKRQFLPPDYKDLVYQEYLNCKQSGNSIAVYTRKFYRLQSYLDFNESEEYSISRYKNGLCLAIRERLSSQSFYYLTDLVLAATHAEQLLEKERKELWKNHIQQGITTGSSTYATVSVDHMGSGFSISSKAKTDAEAIQDKDHMSDIREEQEQLRQSVSLARYQI